MRWKPTLTWESKTTLPQKPWTQRDTTDAGETVVLFTNTKPLETGAD